MASFVHILNGIYVIYNRKNVGYMLHDDDLFHWDDQTKYWYKSDDNLAVFLVQSAIVG